MILLDIKFIDLKFIDIIDIVLVAYLLFALYKLIRGSVAINIFVGLIAVYFLWKFVGFMKLRMLNEILGQFISVGVLALIVVFQQEIRKFLLMIGTTNFRRSGIYGFWKFKIKNTNFANIEYIINACTDFRKNGVGALLVFTKTNDLENILESGVLLNADLSTPLLENIFFRNSPLHDGAVVITNGKIRAARCVLPLSNNPQFPADYGLRHRAALGITEHSDALCVVISEQTSQISVSENGILTTNITIELLKELIEKKLN